MNAPVSPLPHVCAVRARGFVVGAVMKATKGQADAARVCELVLAACGQG